MRYKMKSVISRDGAVLKPNYSSTTPEILE